MGAACVPVSGLASLKVAFDLGLDDVQRVVLLLVDVLADLAGDGLAHVAVRVLVLHPLERCA